MPLFADVEEAQLQAIADDIRQRHFGRGSIIFREDDQGQTLYMVKSGAVRIFANTPDGHETTLILCSQPGDVFGELAAVDGRPRSATAVTLCPTLLYSLSADHLYKHLRQCPQLALNFMNELSNRQRITSRFQGWEIA
jgi:CRP-like cAMP-binding protein